jgi:orotidine-5'-phosphate decarboxylase
VKPDIAVALDVPGAAEALRLVEAAGSQGTWYKVGPVLFVRDGPALVAELLRRGTRVFLDLKWHDIPNTVAGAVESASQIGVPLATVHLAGGRHMLAAAAAARGGNLRLAGVGVLTSLGAADYGAAIGRPVPDLAGEQRRFAELAAAAGLDAMVCAAHEAAVVREILGPDRWLVMPGIRRPADAAADQARTTTPGDAVAAGANLLVVGRPITAAAEPARVLAEFRRAMAA